ncbi:MAG TPA: ester cyclase [Longimicrobium sp.]|nr:ester cyclase [Longimicrobium sp.]
MPDEPELTEQEARNRDVVRRMYEVFNTGDLAVIDEIVAEDMVSANPHPGTANNREGLKQQIRFLRHAFPDARFREEEILVEGDKVFFRWAMEATHQGDYMGMEGSGRPMTHHGQEFLRLRDGRVVEHHGEESNLEFMDKLGAGGGPPHAVHP